MKCPSCSADFPPGATFCAFCGERVSQCRPCGRAFTSDIQFCGFCGKTLSDKPAFRARAHTDARKIDLQKTSPGHPGPDTAKPTFMLPGRLDEQDPDLFGFLFEAQNPSRRYRLQLGDNTLGAGPHNDIVIDRPAISWSHALLICRSQKVLAQDSASTNGTFINDTRIFHPQPLEHTDKITFGNVTFELWLKTRYRS